jgi:simple sugar transport system permease protein
MSTLLYSTYTKTLGIELFTYQTFHSQQTAAALATAILLLVIFANWNPVMAILGTLVFGFFNTLQIYAGALAGAFPGGLGWLNAVPAQLFKALPFIITAIVLIASSVRKKEGSGQPAALGLNYFREER